MRLLLDNLEMHDDRTVSYLNSMSDRTIAKLVSTPERQIGTYSIRIMRTRKIGKIKREAK